MSKVPVAPYNMVIPNNKIPEANDPIKKYFIPASLLFMFNLSLPANTYNPIDNTSMPKKNMAKLLKLTIATAPESMNTFIEIKSDNFELFL